MYNDYMQNLFRESYSPYYNTYESSIVRNNNLDNNENYYDYPFLKDYEIPTNHVNQYVTSRNFTLEIESLYPEIYTIIYPMVKKLCSTNSRPITENTLNEMANEIYNNIETDNTLNLNISVASVKSESRSSSNSSNNKTINSEKNNDNNRNYNPLRDLIKILLIRELIENYNLGFSQKPRPFQPMPFPPPNPNIPRYPRPPISPRF